ncbi:enoyl-CoA hydratase/isomerase family protein [Pseudomonas cavernae]|uniref:Enoyl-CoA hydratase/isomerase family protein n=1 Tax=Pseudomonas cavernae TaxID=2320867 RepID=A0A385Z4L6_9PSED|nr:enoyl-CoA hydratase/isomerase family protein [Pseudomonas cavernae]AYC34076.1 enoyl-CoA hydratase/isomerase family protein [Pseudomonas cavernae]
MNPSTIELSIDNGLAILVMARPERKNALTPQMFAELLDALNGLRRNPEVKAVLLTGAGSDFCSGGDVGNMQGEQVEAAVVRRRMEENNRLLLAMADFDKPLIAAVDGVAFGAGFSLALAADFLIASERARFCMAFARLGLGPDLGASYTLPRVVGLQKAKEIIFSAREVPAQEALQLGIALEVHPAETFRARAEELARAMANLSPTGFSMTKRLLGASLESDLVGMLDAEASNQAVCMASNYLKDAAARFARKEPPLYQWPKRKDV